MDSRRFARLSLDIKKDLTPEDIKHLKVLMAEEYGEGELQTLKDFLDIWNKLKGNGKIKPGDLKYLREKFDDLNLAAPIEKIDKALGTRPKSSGARTKGNDGGRVGPLLASAVQAIKLTESQQPEDETGEGPYPVSTVHPPVEVEAFPDLVYEVKANMKNRGVMLIINQFTKERKGTLSDVTRLNELFKNKLNFHVDLEENLTKDKILKALEDQVSMMKKNDSEVDRFFCVILSHGDQDGLLCCLGDGKTVETVETERDGAGKKRSQKISLEKEILPMFRADNLPKMKGRPKVFIVQACRGLRYQSSVVTDDATATSTSTAMNSRYIPNEADFLIAYPQTDGFKSFRDEEEGSWFIQCLVKVFEARYNKDDLQALLTKVGYEVSLKYTYEKGEVVMQMPCFMSTLRKRLYLT